MTLALLLAATAGAAEPAGLQSALPQPVVPQRVTASGRVLALTTARVSPRVAGIIATFALSPDGKPLDTGMRVKKGQPLFRLDDTPHRNAVAVAEAAHALAVANLTNLKAPPRPERVTQLESTRAELAARLADREREAERYRRLVEEEKTLPIRRLEEVQTEVLVLRALKAAAESRLLEAKNGPTATEIAVAEAQVKQAAAGLKTAQDDLRDATVLAAFDGVVTGRSKSVGDYIPAGTEVLSLISEESLEAELRLPESYLPSVQAGRTTAVLRSPLLPQSLELTVSRAVDSVDAARGVFIVRVAIPAEKKGQLVAGAFVTASVELAGERRSFFVPQRAVREQEGKSYVLVADEGTLKRLEVQPGERMTETVVVSGLSEGQRVYFGPEATVKEGVSLN
jgi:multidrug resistance efflux pump